MVGKSNNGKKKERNNLKENHVKNNKRKDETIYPAFQNGELPGHHFKTVRDWLAKLGDELTTFSEAMSKKIKQEIKKTGVFESDELHVNDINNSLFSFYNFLDSSIDGLLNFRSTTCDYVSTWKVTMKDALICESSDSSVEILENTQSLRIEKNVTENDYQDNIKSTNVEKEGNDDSKTMFGGLRIRKPSEVNKLTLEDVSNGGSNSAEVSNSSLSGNYNNEEKDVSLEKEIPSITNLSLENKIDDLDSTDECIIIPESDAPTTPEPQTASKPHTPHEGRNTINWDTSDTEMSDIDFLLDKKKKNKKNENKDGKKKHMKKKAEIKKKETDSLFSSSEDDCTYLCKLGNLDQKKRKRSDSNCSSHEEHKPQESKVPKIKESQPSVLDFMNDCPSDRSDSYASDDLYTINNEKYKSSLQEVDSFKAEDFFNSDIEERSISVISDSSLDSIVNELVKKCKVKRGTSKKKISSSQTEKLAETKKKVKRKRDRLLDEKLSDTGSSEAEEKWKELKMKKRIHSSDSSEGEEDEVAIKDPKDNASKKTKKKPRKTIFSDSDEQIDESDSSEDQDDEESDTDLKPADKKKRKRIQKHSESSNSDDDPTPSKSADGKGRKNIRKLLKEESLEKSTKEALKEEEERKQRILEKQSLYNELIRKASEHVEVLEELVLDFDVETKKPLVSVDKDLVRKLKPHQAEGIKFMWDSCFESVKDAKKNKGSGCILAHCMGLGKTLQVISLVHTLLTSKEVDVKRVLVVCPFSTVQNWVNEFGKWLKHVGSGEDIDISDMIKTAPNHRVYQLRDWERRGGVMVLGYNLFRTLAAPKGRQKASVKKAIEETLLDPGPDLVICDEGHILKNEKTAISVVMNKLATRRRIVLTGTPLQNNLAEYHCMVQFVKPNLLGTRKEFQNRFVHPITNGQFEDSTAQDVKLMKRRAHVLHKMLDGIVQRKDYNVLTPYLPPKYEYVIHVKLTEVQCKLYRHYLENFARTQKNEGGGLFTDFQHLMRICSHPRSLLIHSDKESLKAYKEEEDDSEGSIRDFIDDDSEESSKSSDESSSSSSGSSHHSTKTPQRKRVTRAQKASGEVLSEEEEELPVKRTEWWSNIVSKEELEAIKSSSKLYLFFTILKHAEEIGDKMLVFSQSLYTLDLLEYFLQQVDDNSRRNESDKDPGLSEFSSSWDKGLDYFRLDGGTNSDCRSNWCKIFNSPKNTRARLFLISTKAGGLGINLTGANRVIIFDASWNPSFDVQSIFRVFRFGQDKPCYIYRFLSKGTMEEKIYERQVAKLSTSLRVIDEQQIDRHFSQTSLAELYVFNPDPPENRETFALPKDRLMAELLQAYADIILTYHQHDSLLENQEGEELNEEERRAAWVEFENEKNAPPTVSYNKLLNPVGFFNQYGTGAKLDTMQFAMQYNNILNILVQRVRLGNPTMTEEAVRKRAAEILAQQNIMQSLIQQQQQQMSLMAGWQTQNQQAHLANLPLRSYPPQPVNSMQPALNNINQTGLEVTPGDLLSNPFSLLRQYLGGGSLPAQPAVDSPNKDGAPVEQIASDKGKEKKDNDKEPQLIEIHDD